MRDVISDPIFPGAAVAEKGMGWGCDHRSTVYKCDPTFSKQGQATKSVECVVPRTLERISDIPTQTKPLLSSLLQKVSHRAFFFFFGAIRIAVLSSHVCIYIYIYIYIYIFSILVFWLWCCRMYIFFHIVRCSCT